MINQGYNIGFKYIFVIEISVYFQSFKKISLQTIKTLEDKTKKQKQNKNSSSFPFEILVKVIPTTFGNPVNETLYLNNSAQSKP